MYQQILKYPDFSVLNAKKKIYIMVIYMELNLSWDYNHFKAIKVTPTSEVQRKILFIVSLLFVDVICENTTH